MNINNIILPVLLIGSVSDGLLYAQEKIIPKEGSVAVESFDVNADKMTTPTRFKLRVDSIGFTKPGEPTTSYMAGKGSRFSIYSGASNPKVVKFNKVKRTACVKDTVNPCDDKMATEDQFYNLDESQIKDYYYRPWGVIDHGILIVPFKFRTEDQSLTGQSTLGYYFGLKNKYNMGSGTWFGSIGLSQVEVPVGGDTTESRTGFSMSGGMLFQGRDGFQVALVVGSDRLGGAAGEKWKYEKDIWISIGLGFNIATTNGRLKKGQGGQ